MSGFLKLLQPKHQQRSQHGLLSRLRVKRSPVDVLSARSFSTNTTTESNTDVNKPIVNSNTKVDTKSDDKKKSTKKKFSLWALIKNNKFKSAYVLMLLLGYYFYDSRCYDKGQAEIQKMSGVPLERQKQQREIATFTDQDIDLLMGKAYKKSYQGMIDIEFASRMIHEQVQRNRRKRSDEAVALMLEKSRIEEELRREMNGEAPQPPVAAPTVGWWEWMTSGSASSAPTAAEPVVISKEFPYRDWNNDVDNDDIPMNPLDAMSLLTCFPTFQMRGINLIRVSDLGVALSAIASNYVTPASPKHYTSLPKDMLQKYNLDMERIFTTYKDLCESRDGLMSYIDVLTGSQYDRSRVVPRVQAAVEYNHGQWAQMTAEEQEKLVQRIFYVSEYKNTGVGFLVHMDSVPESNQRQAWKAVLGPKTVATKKELEALFSSMMTGGHFLTSALIQQDSLWPVQYSTVTADKLATEYMNVVDQKDKIQFDQLVTAAKVMGFLKKHELWYYQPTEYTVYTDFQLWRKRKYMQIMGLDIEEINQLHLLPNSTQK